MAWTAITGLPNQFFASDGSFATNYYLKAYQSGTTTPTNMATDSTGGTQVDKFRIDSQGFIVNASNGKVIPHIDQDYKLVLYPSEATADADDTGSAIFVIDAIGQNESVGNADAFVAEYQAGSSASGQVFTLTTLTAATDGSNLRVFRNGQRLLYGASNDYTVPTSTTVNINSAITIRDADVWLFEKG